VLEQTRALAQRLLGAAPDDCERIRRAYELLYGRRPEAQETRIGLDFLTHAGTDRPGWEAYCQLLLCANEFLYVD
jgi:hypothetical protein